jgi:DNA modification methylase
MTVIGNSIEWRWVPIETVKPYDRVLRHHARQKINKLKKLIARFGQVTPVVVGPDNVIVDGHAMYCAMRERGAGEIAIITVQGRTDPELKALRLALNRLPAEAAWDDENLRAELQELVDVSFDLEITGFDAAEIDGILDFDVVERGDADDGSDLPALGQTAVTAKGDVWTCGRHRVGCGDALDAAFVARVCAGVKADVAFIDPPYNVPVDGFVSGRGKVRHREFAQAVGEMSPAEFQAFLVSALKVLQVSSNPGALAYVCMDWRHLLELMTAGRECELELLNLVVWAKTNGGMGSLYRNQHELICVFKHAGAAHTNNVELGRHGRNRTNVWTYRGMNAFGGDRDALLAAHPTVKPVLLVADVLRDVTNRRGVVLDTFLGSGTTLMAADETGRTCLGTEIDPLYVDVAIRRWQAKTARDAVDAVSGELFCDREARISAPDGVDERG